MSKQLRLSATFSVLALAALALSEGPVLALNGAPTETGATVEAAAPALIDDSGLPALPSFLR